MRTETQGDCSNWNEIQNIFTSSYFHQGRIFAQVKENCHLERGPKDISSYLILFEMTKKCFKYWM